MGKKEESQYEWQRSSCRLTNNFFPVSVTQRILLLKFFVHMLLLVIINDKTVSCVKLWFQNSKNKDVKKAKYTWMNILLFIHAKVKHCQRHNGPGGWVHITTLQFTVHKSWSNYNNISSSTKFKLEILTKIQLRNLNQTSVQQPNSESWPSLVLKV